MSSRIIERYKVERQYVEQCRDNPLHGADFPCVKAKLIGPGIPGFYHPERCQILFVGDFPTKAEVDSTDKFRSPFVDPKSKAKAMTKALQDSGLYGDDRVGFTNLVKCSMPTRRSWKKCAEQCLLLHLTAELEVVRPLLVVLLGEPVAAAVTPAVIDTYGYYTMNGETFTVDDTQYMYLEDPSEFLTGSGQSRKATEYKYLFIEKLKSIKEDFMMDHDEYFAFTYAEEDLKK